MPLANTMQRSPPDAAPLRTTFPPDFIFGVATSAYQIEGSAPGGAGTCHGDTMAAAPGTIAERSNGSRACGHFHRRPDDLDLVRDRGLSAYRFSTSWPRIMPSRLTVDPAPRFP